MLIVPSVNTAGAVEKMLISPSTPANDPPSGETHNGKLITWCSPNGISNLFTTPYAAIIPALPQ